MVASWSRDFAFEQLRQHQALISAAADQNEATTRVRAIDTMLFSVLGWGRSIVEAEKYCRAVGYADYIFRQDKSICLVLEAKRDEASFVLPARAYGANPVGFALLSSECPAAQDALTQASGYSAALGARYSCISNGHHGFSLFRLYLTSRSTNVLSTFSSRLTQSLGVLTSSGTA